MSCTKVRFVCSCTFAHSTGVQNGDTDSEAGNRWHIVVYASFMSMRRPSAAAKAPTDQLRREFMKMPNVGKATAGGVISAVNTAIPDVGVLQIPFRGWYHEKSGQNYDLGGAVPDFDIDLTPADENSEQDPQLQKALEILDPKL